MDQLTAEDPTRIGPYRLIARLGAGGMGLVYLGRSEGGRTVAVKVVQAEFARHPEFRRRFTREVAAARRVGGDWTAAVLDADTEAATPWAATRYVPGPDLHHVVAEDFGPLPGASVRSLTNGLAQALCDIHRAGLVHRDLKPSNVLITVDGPRVIDFGIARALEGVAGDSLHTRTGMLIGSPGFMSPEQVRGLQLTPASDVFCLGAVIAYAATGRLPFGPTEAGPHAQIYRIAQEEPDLEGVPAALLPLVRECLHKDPARRPTPQQIAERTAADTDEAWLPGELLIQLGRRAGELLDYAPPQPVGRTPTAVDGAAPGPTAAAPPRPSSTPTAPALPPQPHTSQAPGRPHASGVPHAPRPPAWRVVRTALAYLLAVVALLVTYPVVDSALGIDWSGRIRPEAVVLTVVGACLAVPVAHRAHRPLTPLPGAALTGALAFNLVMLLWHLQVAPFRELRLPLPGLDS